MITFPISRIVGRHWSCQSIDGSGLTLSNMIRLKSSDHVKRRGKISWESHRMRMGYVLDKPLSATLPEGSSPEERLTFEKWHEDNRKVRSIILASMTNEIQKQYDRFEDVPSIMLRMKDVYAVPDRHIKYAATKAFFGTKMTEGSSVHSHGVKMLSLVKKLEDLNSGLNNDTYIDVILQSLPPSYDPFIVNYNMNGLEKSIHELINMLVQYEATTHKSEPTVLVGEASTSKAKDKGARAGRGRRARERRSQPLLAPEVLLLLPRRERAKGRLGVLSGRRQMMCACIAKERGIGRGSVHNSSPTQVLERSRRLSKDEMILRLGDGKAVAAEAVGSLRLVGKMTKKPFVGQSAITNGLLDFAHTDVCGPLSIPARGGFSYFITFTDDHSLYGYVYLMRYKSEAFGRFKEYRLEVENQTNRKIKALRSDRGGEYLSGEFIDYLKENGILSQWTPPGTPQLNGVAERRNRTLLDMYPGRYMRYGMASLCPTSLSGIRKILRDTTSMIRPSKGFLSRGTQYSWKRVFHRIIDVMRSTRESRIPERYGFVGLTSQLDNDPKTYIEAMSDIDSDKWIEAMKSEMDSMGSNQVWTLVDPLKGARPVRCKWVYKCKLGANGEVTAFKARLMAKGYTQRPGVDFEKTYSPVAMAKSIRILLAIAAWYDYSIWQMDVKTTFLNGFDEEEIFMDQPEGFTDVGEEQKVCRLQRSIYGLKQAFRSWNTHFDEVIRGYDFIKNDCDPCIYKKISGSSVAYLVLYVDDILLIGNYVKILGDIKAWLSTQFSMKDMGEASYILGIKIYRDRSRRMLGLTQSSYIEKVLKRYKMEHSKRGVLPMRHGIKLSKKQSPKTDEELKRMSNIPYASAVGSIQYAVQCTRPDVAYALSVMSRYQACAGEAHWGAVKSILKYLKRTKDMFLIYSGGELILEGYSDASFQSDNDDAKSQSGFIFKLNGVVAWKSSK
ncbi:UNVERIFIED_CONTAM: Retrovirus-related Pol polyprotein from transposon TNT 1-94 [Sesamum latifolium]|uniref:Retrovirus-related Pol polyprotein from transposon TNT 1-94 n=1 Tax=Sesamum latifolium TaxID=2727402 RepID=A0AAW2XN74_9LAMI